VEVCKPQEHGVASRTASRRESRGALGGQVGVQKGVQKGVWGSSGRPSWRPKRGPDADPETKREDSVSTPPFWRSKSPNRPQNWTLKINKNGTKIGPFFGTLRNQFSVDFGTLFGSQIAPKIDLGGFTWLSRSLLHRIRDQKHLNAEILQI